MKALFRKSAKGLLPDSNEAANLFAKIPDDTWCMVEYVRTRNYQNHKRFFRFLEVAFECQDFYQVGQEELFRKAIQMLAGHYDELIIKGKKGEDATIHYIPKTIAFEEMDEIEFSKLFSKCVTGFFNRYGTGMTEQEFLKVLEFD